MLINSSDASIPAIRNSCLIDEFKTLSMPINFLINSSTFSFEELIVIAFFKHNYVCLPLLFSNPSFLYFSFIIPKDTN